MAKVKTFRIQKGIQGIPDREIRDFVTSCEKDAFVNVTTTYIPAEGEADSRVIVIVTKLDSKEPEESRP